MTTKAKTALKVVDTDLAATEAEFPQRQLGAPGRVGMHAHGDGRQAAGDEAGHLQTQRGAGHGKRHRGLRGAVDSGRQRTACPAPAGKCRS